MSTRKLKRTIALMAFVLMEVLIYVFFIEDVSAGYDNSKKIPDTEIALIATPNLNALKINFQNGSRKSPAGWISDLGFPFGEKAGTFETARLCYGWKDRRTNYPVNLSENARIRKAPDDLLLNGLMHMQANTISWWRGAFKGVRTESYWEIKVLNGWYDVITTVGDSFTGKCQERDCINIEGKKVIENFEPIGKGSSYGRFKTAAARIEVKDGYLTVTADGGINTKINNIQITPVKIYPYIKASVVNPDLLIAANDTGMHHFKLTLENSLNKSINYSLKLVYRGNKSNWLHLLTNGNEKNKILDFDYDASNNFPEGTYFATLNLSAPGFSEQLINVGVRVVDGKRPYVISSSPINGSNNVSVNTSSIAANNLYVPFSKGFKGGIDNKTITDKTVKVFEDVNGRQLAIKGVVQGTGGGDAITFSPSGALDPNAHYTFKISDEVKAYSGKPVNSYEIHFSTGAIPRDTSKSYNCNFTKVAIPGTQHKSYTSLTFGPDGKFYALRMDGVIERYDIDHSTGMLTGQNIINTLKEKYGERTAIGLVFDPSSTPTNLIAWVTHSSAGLTSAPVFDGNISRLEGNDLSREQLIISRLPRSTRDHMVNGVAFGPDGCLYICQGSNSSAGAYDMGWQRDETLLAGTILRLDIKKLNGMKFPLNVETSADLQVINHASINNIRTSDGRYNPYSVKSPLTIYASGIRNAYDLVWHTNGQLYIPANGSGGGGNSPGSVKNTRRPDGTFYKGPVIPATSGVQVQHDWLFRVNPNKGVGYFGHPNPLRGEYVVNRGYTDNPLYKKNTRPDINYRPAAFDFGLNHSPNGIIEYKSNAFNGTLKGMLLVCRFSGGGDIMILEPGSLKPKGDIEQGKKDDIFDIVNSERGSGNSGLTGMSDFANPLDIVEDTINGNLYLSEFNWNDNPNLISQITLLKVAPKANSTYIAKNKSQR